ncbi:site-specific DNA-methyltransferase [Enterobacter sp. BNK-34]|uniref:site-specific DNA-methyltransferase n=1 Tax=Enterobacter sp. BNK-34 TaxID=3376171 RepID=UPI003B433903
MDKLKMHSPNLVEQNIDKLAALFPNCVTESKDENGKLKQAIDFDLLKQELSRHIVDGPQERYQLNWPGKREALLTANAPIAKTLRPCREESVNFDTTRNLFIEGDNLDALKLLQETYLGKVKMIYIDPPYNTGNDFIYEDDFAEEVDSYIKRSGQKDEYGNRLVVNLESNGRYHSDWMSMLYSRLKLARNLISEDGVIFISIDDGEVANLRKMCDEVFGAENFIANVIWQKRYSVSSDAKGIPPMHDHIIVYQKSDLFIPNLLPRTQEQDSVYKNLDNDPRGRWRSDNLTRNEYRERDYYPIVSPTTGEEFYPPDGASWRHPKNEIMKMIADNRIWFGKDGKSRPSAKRFLSEVKQGRVASAWWPFSEVGHTDESKKELQNIFGGKSPFDTPKPTRLIKRMLDIASGKDSIILDFFAGSGTTAHAVLKQNQQDGGQRRFILVQLPETCNEKSNAFKLGYKSVSEITKERIRKVGGILSLDDSIQAWNKDVGFRVLKVDSSNMDDVYYDPASISQRDLFLHVENIRHDRTEEDLLFQVMLDWGVDLTLPIHRETIADKKVFFVDAQPDNSHGALVACFDKTGGIDEDFIKQLAAFSPLRLVFRDAGFASDAAKTNAEQLLKQLSATTDVKTI